MNPTTEKWIIGIVSLIVGVIGGIRYASSPDDVDSIRRELLTGRVICKQDGLDEQGKVKFDCKTKEEIEDVLKFIGGMPNVQRQNYRSTPKEKKVISIYNGKPVDEPIPEVSEAVVTVLQTLIEQAYAGNISQVLAVTMNDDSVAGARVIAGETVNPEAVYTQLDLLKDDYKMIFIRPYDYFEEGIDE